MALQQNQKSEQQSLEQIVAGVQDDQKKVAGAQNEYINCAATAGFTVGPEGATLDGWITYTAGGQKIYYKLESLSSYWGLFAGGAAMPLIGALKPEVLAGKVGQFKAEGTLSGGVLRFWLNGVPVFTVPLILAGVGSPFGWGAEGTVRFHAAA